MRVLDPENYRGVPLPENFPGAFFVLEWDREGESYVLTLDDDDHSSYDLGDDVESVVRVFTSRGYPAIPVERFIDEAREFGASQYIPSPYPLVEDRVLPIIPRAAKTVPLNFGGPRARYQHLKR